MFKELVINVTDHETRVALLEDGTIVELFIERSDDMDIAGNIYKGKVQRVLPGMQAAFVDIGLNQAAFIYVDDIYGEHYIDFEEQINNNDEENGTTINNSKKSNTSHYGTTGELVNTSNCTDCHLPGAQGAKWGNAFEVPPGMGTTNAQCYLCHMDTVGVGPETSIGFHEGNLSEWNWNSCDQCHYTGGRR